MNRLALSMLLSVCAVTFAAGDAFALPKFKTAFSDKYLKDHKDADFTKLAKKESCNACHLKGLKKKVANLNPYGKELSKLIEGDAKHRQDEAKAKGGKAAADAELEVILKELDKAFVAVAKVKSPTGDTYGERIATAKLPVDPEVTKKAIAEAKAKEQR